VLRSRAQRRTLDYQLSNRHGAAIDAAGYVATAETEVARLTREQAAHDRHEQDHRWRRDAIDNTWELLNQHRTDVALACVRADQTLAYGVEPLRIGRRHLAHQLATIEASLPPDLSSDRERARNTLRTHTAARYEAEQRLARSQATLDQQLARRWPRRDKTATSQSTSDVHAARQLVTDTHGNENSTRQHLAQIDRHQKTRATELAATATQRHALSFDIGQLDTALHHTRADRVQRLADRPNQFHLDILGPVPQGPQVEPCGATKQTGSNATSTTPPTTTPHGSGSSNDLSNTPTLTSIAERHIAIQPRHQLCPTDWAPIAQHAAALHAATIEHARLAPHHALELDLGL
jgi:hypothetical protein